MLVATKLGRRDNPSGVNIEVGDEPGQGVLGVQVSRVILR
jgi:hypothetical protein